jgi:hypothetical protein
MEAIRTISIAEVRRLAEQAGMRLREQVSKAGNSHYSVLRSEKEMHHSHNLDEVAEWLSSWVQHVR